MKKTFGYLLVVCVLLSAQENKLLWDGKEWHSIEQETTGYPEYRHLVKAAYVNGLLDGRLYDYLKTWSADSALADSLFVGELTDYLKTSEIVKGLDNFYADPLNSYVPISSAVIIVNMYAQRQPLDMIDAYTERSKEWINNLMLQMQREDIYRLMTQKQKRYQPKRD